jgi:hypothetical protein
MSGGRVSLFKDRPVPDLAKSGPCNRDPLYALSDARGCFLPGAEGAGGGRQETTAELEELRAARDEDLPNKALDRNLLMDISEDRCGLPLFTGSDNGLVFDSGPLREEFGPNELLLV